MKFGQLIKSTRLEKGLLIRELALKAKVSLGYISLIEQGKRNPTINNAVRIAKAVGLDIGMLELLEPKRLLSYGNRKTPRTSRRKRQKMV